MGNGETHNHGENDPEEEYGGQSGACAGVTSVVRREFPWRDDVLGSGRLCASWEPGGGRQVAGAVTQRRIDRDRTGRGEQGRASSSGTTAIANFADESILQGRHT